MRPKFEAVEEIREKSSAVLRSVLAEAQGRLFHFLRCHGRLCEENRCAGKGCRSCDDRRGATYPYGKDPHDSNIRIAPSFPPLEELVQATELFVLCVSWPAWKASGNDVMCRKRLVRALEAVVHVKARAAAGFPCFS